MHIGRGCLSSPHAALLRLVLVPKHLKHIVNRHDAVLCIPCFTRSRRLVGRVSALDSAACFLPERHAFLSLTKRAKGQSVSAGLCVRLIRSTTLGPLADSVAFPRAVASAQRLLRLSMSSIASA